MPVGQSAPRALVLAALVASAFVSPGARAAEHEVDIREVSGSQ